MMTKNRKAVIFFIYMRITFNHNLGQSRRLLYPVFFLFFCAVIVSGCSGRKDEGPVLPPITSPLSREYIGFGVITASFTHITEEPAEGTRSMGYLRRGSLVRIVRRQNIRTGNNIESWVLTDDTPQGWLREDVMVIFDTECQAATASQSLLR